MPMPPKRGILPEWIFRALTGSYICHRLHSAMINGKEHALNTNERIVEIHIWLLFYHTSRILTRAKKSEQCAGFFRVSYKRKTARPFFASRLTEQIRAVRDLQRARSAKFPAEELCASPITQRAVNVALCVLIRNCSRLSYLLLHPKG